MKRALKILAISLISFGYHAHAQQVVKTDTLSGTPLSITMDNRVDAIMSKMEDNCARPENSNGEDSHIRNPSTSTTPKITVPPRALTNAEICRQNPKISGYKIQLVVVKSNEEANKVKAYFRNRFPEIKVQTDASLRPNYKILAGSYFTKESASQDLKRIRQYFKSAIPVQYYIFCVEGK